MFWSISFKIFIIQTLSTVMQLFKGSYFSVGAASRHFWPNSAIANSTTHLFRNLWVLFHLPQGRVLKIIYFSKFFQWNKFYRLSHDCTLILIVTFRPHTAGVHQAIVLIYWVGLFVPPWLLKDNNWYYSYWKVFYLLKMRNLSRKNSVREWIWKKLVDKK